MEEGDLVERVASELAPAIRRRIEECLIERYTTRVDPMVRVQHYLDYFDRLLREHRDTPPRDLRLPVSEAITTLAYSKEKLLEMFPELPQYGASS